VEVLGSTFEWVWWQLLQALEVLCLSIIGLTIAVSKPGNVEATMSLGRGSLRRRTRRRAWQISGQYCRHFKNEINAKMSEAIHRWLSVKK